MSRKVVFDFDGVIQEKGEGLPLIKLVDLLYFDMDYGIIILTARNESHRKYVVDRLEEYELAYDALIMCPDDVTDYSEWKLREIKKLEPVWMIFDDCPSTINLLEEAKLPIVAIRSDYYDKEEVCPNE